MEIHKKHACRGLILVNPPDYWGAVAKTLYSAGIHYLHCFKP